MLKTPDRQRQSPQANGLEEMKFRIIPSSGANYSENSAWIPHRVRAEQTPQKLLYLLFHPFLLGTLGKRMPPQRTKILRPNPKPGLKMQPRNGNQCRNRNQRWNQIRVTMIPLKLLRTEKATGHIDRN